MRKMKRSDVREWVPGEPIERVDFGDGCTGMNKSIPKVAGKRGRFQASHLEMPRHRSRRRPMP